MEKYQKGALSHQRAKERFQLFSPNTDVKYHLFLKLMKGESFEGRVAIEFDLLKIASTLFLDYSGASVDEIIINGNRLESTDNYQDLRDNRLLRLPETNLKAGKNTVTIRYSTKYANDGLGLHSFTDTDGKQYLYSQGEIYEINKIFPCFDQPDLKATLDLVMAVPNDWVAIANEIPSEEALKSLNLDLYLSKEDQKGYKVTVYPGTPRLSTYLFAFIAGAYREIKCTNLHRDIQMSCYCRETLFPFMKEQVEEIFEVTRESLAFYESFFNCPYPFSKYDSIFGPEFFFFAMENAGAVVFDDQYLWREAVTLDRSVMRSVLIAHEAAHHWFGNLVTMKWWNDIWLNESFAEFISYFCLDNIRPKMKKAKLDCSWVKFFEETDWGYSDDQKRTTHPIAGEVIDTTQALSVFDGITYSKGAASLKQIMHLIGRENFGQAMSSYFKKYAWSNTTLDEFIASLQEYYKPFYLGSPANLDEWKNEWLLTAGVNECLPLFNIDDHSPEAKLVIRQTAALEGFPTLRHHKMKVAFFRENAKICEEKEIVLDNTPETVISYNGTKKPRAILLNYQNEAYIKVRLDQQSISFLKQKATDINDDLTKAIIWKSLFDMVRDGQLSAYSFVEAATDAIPKEQSDWILNSILRFSASALKYSPKALNKNVLKPRLFNSVLEILTATKRASDDEKTLVLRQNLIRFASYGKEKKIDNIERLIRWLDGTDEKLKDVELDVQNMWNIVIAIHKHPELTDSRKSFYFNKVADIDSSDRMILMEKRCEAMRAQSSLRKRLFQSFLEEDGKVSAHVMEQAMKGYSRSLWYEKGDEGLFFDNIIEVFERKSNESSKVFFKALFPKRENFSYYVEKLRNLLEKVKGNELLHRLLIDTIDDLERKKKGYLCCSCDIMKCLFDISL